MRPFRKRAANSRENGNDGSGEAQGARRREGARLPDADRRQMGNGCEGRTLERVAPGHGVTVSRYQAATEGMPNGRSPLRAKPSMRPVAAHDGVRALAVLLKAADMIAARADELAYLDASNPASRSARPRASWWRRRYLALCRRPCPRSARRELQYARRRHARCRPARGDRRRLDHHAVELPVPDRQPEAAFCACCRLHDGRQAVRTDLGLDAGARRNPRRRPAFRQASSISSPAPARMSARS